MQIQQNTELVLTRDDIRKIDWSVPFYEEIMNSDAREGISRHGRLTDAVNHIPKQYKPDYPTHVRTCIESGWNPTGLVLAFGFRNSGPNNLGLPGYDTRRKHRLFARRDEPWESWIYFAFVMFRDGSFELQRVRFAGPGGESILLLDAPNRSGDVLWAITGQPLVWDGLVPSHSTLAAMTYDQRHPWHMSWESHEQSLWPTCRHHLDAHSALMDAFMAHLNDPIRVRAAELARIGAEFGLSVEDSYIHSTLGIRDNGDLVLMVRRGSLTQLGAAQSALSRRAILLDNGGSVGYGVFAPDKLVSGALDAPPYIGNASYFRPNAHSLALIETTLMSLESKAFGPRLEDRDLFALLD